MKRHQKDILKFPISPLAKAGMRIKNMADESHSSEHDRSNPHRDDHYLLMIATDGRFMIDIDFEKHMVEAPVMLMIFPGQVHHVISATQPVGWGLSIDPSLVDEELQLVLENSFLQSLTPDQESSFFEYATQLMRQMEKMQVAAVQQFTVRAMHSLLDALLSLLAAEILRQSTRDKTNGNRAASIERNFKQLLKSHYKQWKQPAQYAAELNISVAHLYDSIRKTSGDSVSAFIQQYCMLEAKRLLCFTSLTVREIGYELGYEEPVYFGKLFKKVTGLTPLAFRREYHD